MEKERIKIFDTTLRDGEQTPGVAFRAKDKLSLAFQLEKLGVDVIEAGFPANSQKESEAVSAVALQVRKPSICALARAIPEDIDIAWKSVQDAKNPRIHVFISSSDIHLAHQLKKDKREVLEMAVSGVKRAKTYCNDIEFSAMDATRSDRKFLYELIEATIQAGATTINVPDTVGFAIPGEFALLIKNILNGKNIPSIKKITLSVHCHNDLGNAVSNSLAAVKEGVRQVECCVNGIGERAGNAALEEVVMSIHTRADWFNACTGIEMGQIYSTSKMVEEITGIPICQNKPIVGENVFTHESGIHQDGVLKNSNTYEIMDSKVVGRFGSEIIIGKTSGKNGISAKLSKLGFDFDRESPEFDFVYKEIRGRIVEGSITDDEIKKIIKSCKSR